MKRVIKFRGKRLEDGEWIYGYLADEDYINNINEITMPSEEIDPDTVGQFTGLKDAKGNEIYEGDIMRTPNKHIIIVKFGYREWIVQQDRTYDSIAAYGWIAEKVKDGFTDFLDNTIMRGEIIGNIHDNSELLNP